MVFNLGYFGVDFFDLVFSVLKFCLVFFFLRINLNMNIKCCECCLYMLFIVLNFFFYNLIYDMIFIYILKINYSFMVCCKRGNKIVYI